MLNRSLVAIPGRRPLVVTPGGREPLVISPTGSRPPVVTPGGKAPQVIIPPKRAIWDDRGWLEKSENGTTVYTGQYQVSEVRSGEKRHFAGRMRLTGAVVETYVLDPPPAAYRRHPKCHCFQVLDAKLDEPVWFRLHWKEAPKDPDTAILYMEKILYEAINYYSEAVESY